METSLKLSLGLLGVVTATLVTFFIAQETSEEIPTPSITTPVQFKISLPPQHKIRRNPGRSDPNFASLTRLAGAATSSEARSAIKAARRELINHRDGEVARDALLNFLEQGYDRSLEASMRVGARGELIDAPTIRVALMDLLGQIDSEYAAEYSRQVLENSSSSDEWAIALRNYSWGVDNTASDPFLRAKVLELLTNAAWVAEPTDGFLEAFDFVPFTHDAALVAPLVNLAKGAEQTSVRRAAFLALERFISQETSVGLQAVAQAEATEPFSSVRADAMARADFSRSEDAKIVEQYLLSSRIDPREFKLFANMFPHGGQFAGPSLATEFQPKPLAELARRDAQALAVVRNWMNDASFAERHQELVQIYDRLTRLHESAVQGGYL